MPSKFGWVDFAEEDRQKMLDVVQLYRERDTRDELGIGTIRDAFSDYFFPGTSTIQTRAKYMLFVPWIYIDLERKKVPASKIDRRARNDELRLIEALLDTGEDEGVIGKEARRGLKRLPSSIYWSGLASWGIRRYPGSQQQYHRYLDTYYQRRMTDYSGETDEEFINPSRIPNWDPGLPEASEDLVYSASLKLNREEAQYLKERLVFSHPDSFFSRLVQRGSANGGVFPWDSDFFSSLPENSALKTEIWHARNFSETIYGAHMLYNLLLSKACDNSERIDEYEDRFSNWIRMIKRREYQLGIWYSDMAEFWNLKPLMMKEHPIPRPTRVFVDHWFKLVFDSPGYEKVMNSQAARSLIKTREFQLKRNRARLENRRALEMWGGESGTRQLSYRWQTASAFVSDIIRGLKRKK